VGYRWSWAGNAEIEKQLCHPIPHDTDVRLIGRPDGPFRLEVSRSAAFARAVGHTDPIYRPGAARAGYRDIAAAPGYLGTWPWSPTNPENRSFAPEVPTPGFTRGLNGGTEIEYHADICGGDVLFATGKISDIQERQGSMGTMLVITREVEFRDGDGNLAAVLRGTSIKY
jgi:hypothetical protein